MLKPAILYDDGRVKIEYHPDTFKKILQEYLDKYKTADKAIDMIIKDLKAIKILPDNVINRIAAGEIVERPASVVKELVENSIDAGALRIDISVINGGRDFISVTDDGSGISHDQALLAFERNATSKISSFDDLTNIMTMGFRGEALPSIAAVSRVVMKTKPGGRDSGVI